MNDDDLVTAGLFSRFTPNELKRLLARRIDVHTKGALKLEEEVPAAKKAYNDLETDIRIKHDNTQAAMDRLEEAQNKYMGAAYQLETHKRWIAFLTFYSEHLAPGVHVLSLADLKQLDLVELPQDFGYAMVPGRVPKAMDHHTLVEFQRRMGDIGFR